jgi:DNA-binding response OmpR family regulator
MSGRLAKEVRPKAMDAGANDFLSKPFPGKILLEKLSALFSQKGSA